MRKARNAELKKYGVSAVESAVLTIVHDTDRQVGPYELSRRLLREPNTISTLLDRMVYKGLITKSKVKPGGRQLRISLTKTGLELYEHVMELDSLYKIFPKLSEEEYINLTSFLQEIQQNAARDIASRRLWSNPTE
ncbi:MarR family winged helix-turn-helix transcriptional regulator [Chloroflexota bacterium]